jgi:hypothetical protein
MKLAQFDHIITPGVRESCWDWNARHIDYAMAATYRASVAGRYNPRLMPWWKDPVNAVTDVHTREVVVMAPTQSGKNEHLVCHPMRYWVGTGANLAVLYVGGQQQKAAEIYEERLKRSLLTTEITAEWHAKATGRGLVWDCANVTAVCTWARAGQGMKGRPFDVVLCDETSSWEDISKIDQARKRGATRPFFKLVVFGSLDPEARKDGHIRDTEEDPLWMEYIGSQASEWMMPDPATGNLFHWEIGEPGDGPGLKWDPDAKDENGRWDLNKVETTAYYRTPDGTELRTEADRLTAIRAGRWVPQNMAAPAWRPGFHIHQMMMPWKNVGGFGHLARRLLESIKQGPTSHRTYRYEIEAWKWSGSASRIEDDVLVKRVGNYDRNTLFTRAATYAQTYAIVPQVTFMTVDVQKFNFWWVIRHWCVNGDSGLVDYGSAVSWQQLNQIANEHDVPHVLVDVGQGDRNVEFGEACATFNFIPCKGASVRVPGLYALHSWNIYEGTSRQKEGQSLELWMWDTQQVKTNLYDRIVALVPERWFIPPGLGPDYFDQVLSEELANGEWRERRTSRGNNHLWDCECLQLLAALVFGYGIRPVSDRGNDGDAAEAAAQTAAETA